MDGDKPSQPTPSGRSERPSRPTRDLPDLPQARHGEPVGETDTILEAVVNGLALSPEHPAELPDKPSLASDSRSDGKTAEKKESEVDPDATKLTPIRAHYLKKTLISLEFDRELTSIFSFHNASISPLSYLGPPFTPPPNDAPRLDLPFLKYAFRQFVLPFPFLAAAPRNFFPDKVQPFVSSMLARNLSSTDVMDDETEDTEQAVRKKLLAKVGKHLAMLLTTATKITEPEELVRLSQADLNRLEMLAKRRQAKQTKEKRVFEVNIVCIRAVVDRGRVRSKVHEEFIIRTRRSDFPDIFVSRRYGDFRTLAEELRKRYPDELVKPPPVKDRSTVSTTTSAPTNIAASPTTTRFPSSKSYNGNTNANSSSESLQSLGTQQAIANIRLAREKNRLTLRAYLHSLLTSNTLGSSPVLMHFLTSNPTRLSQDEEADARIREEADRKRDEGRIRFAHEIEARVEGLRAAVKTVKNDALSQDGLSTIFNNIRATSDVGDLPKEYQSVLEWGRISLASTIFQQYVASDDASETFAALKRLHGLMPYFMLRAILKVSNPMAMVRGVLDIFMAQPFGGRSLLQRMFTSGLQEEVDALKEEIDAVRDKIEDDVICEKLRLFVYAPREIQAIYKADAATEGLNVLTVVLRSSEEPALTRAQMQRVIRAHRAHAAYMKARAELADSDDDDGPQDDEAWLYEDLTILAKLYSQLRDKEQIIELVFEGTTADLLKDIITIFYTPLAQVYRAASIGDTLSELQTFINDLIKTVEAVDESSHDNPNVVVQTFIDLVARHEQSFYSFIHKVYGKGEGLFDNMFLWIQLFIDVFRDGLGDPLSLEFLLPHSGPERENIIKELDAVALYHYKLKLAHETKVRRRFVRSQGESKSDADAEDEAAAVLVNGIVDELSFGELAEGGVEELDAEMTDSSEESESESEEETDTSSGSYETASESDSTEQTSPRQSSDRPPVPPPKPIARSSTLPTSPSPLSAPLSPQVARSTTQRHPSHSTSISHHHEGRGRDTARPSQDSQSGLQRLRSRSRSIGALKSMFSRSSSDAPPVPPLPSGQLHYKPRTLTTSSNSPSPSPAASHPQTLSPNSNSNPRQSTLQSPSPLSARSSTESHPERRRPIANMSATSKKRKARAATLTLKPPELQVIPNLLPLFVEMIRPNLRPTSNLKQQ